MQTRNAGEAPAVRKSCAISTTLADGRVLESDLVMLSIGVAPESTLAREAGLELGLRGSIKVDAAMRTSDPDIYATHDEIARHRGGAQEPQSMLHRPQGSHNRACTRQPTSAPRAPARQRAF